MNITEIINKYNLYPNESQTYVQPFNDGTEFFWDKIPAYTQFVNDVDNRYAIFLKSIREKKQLQKDSIYFEHQNYTQNIDEIRKSNFFKKISNTYLFSRSYDRMILSTDSEKTFYLCFIKPTQNILDDFANIKGKFLFIYKQKQNNDLLCLDNIKPLKHMLVDNYELIFNYEPKKTYDLFNL